MKLSRTLVASFALAAVPLAALASIGTATAQPNNGPAGKPGVGCAVEDATTGAVTYVPIGSQIGLLHCGADGEWHFGTVTTNLGGSGSSTPTGPKVGAVAGARAAAIVKAR